MKTKIIAILLILLNLSCIHKTSAQEIDRGLDLVFLSGLNVGATTPVPIPKDLKLTSYNPKINPKIGVNIRYFFNENWGVGTGLSLDWKGMTIKAKITDIHLSIDVPETGTLTGNVTGKNTIKVNSLYLTQPIYGVYQFNPKWQVKAGIYLSENLSRSFKGSLNNVKITLEDPKKQDREIVHATLDYSKDVRKFEMGLLLGGEFRLNDRFGFYSDFTWGFTPYFEKTVPIHFTMRNIYLSMGVTYRLK